MPRALQSKSTTTMKHTLNEREQSLIQGGCIDPNGGIFQPNGGSTIYDPTQEIPWPDYVIDFKKHLIIH